MKWWIDEEKLINMYLPKEIISDKETLLNVLNEFSESANESEEMIAICQPIVNNLKFKPDLDYQSKIFSINKICAEELFRHFKWFEVYNEQLYGINEKEHVRLMWLEN